MKPRERAAAARAELERPIIDYLTQHPEGAISNQIAKDLGLESDFAGRQKNYLTYSMLGVLLKSGRVVRADQDGKNPFKAV